MDTNAGGGLLRGCRVSLDREGGPTKHDARPFVCIRVHSWFPFAPFVPFVVRLIRGRHPWRTPWASGGVTPDELQQAVGLATEFRVVGFDIREVVAGIMLCEKAVGKIDGQGH